MSSYPRIIYGTAWKEEATAHLTRMALDAGYRAIDTANQPKHYQEALVGTALAEAFAEGVSRQELFIQTKFTPLPGHDHRVPYDARASHAEQVRQSVTSSLENLRTDHLDSLLLHGPYGHPDLTNVDFEVWHQFEKIHRSGTAKLIGVSNVSSRQLQQLIDASEIKPMVVQNRCFATRGWDREVRRVCRDNDIMYQGFSLLTANPEVLTSQVVASISARTGMTSAQVIFCFASQVGMVPLTGTTQGLHMQNDLDCLEQRLLPSEMELLETVGDL